MRALACLLLLGFASASPVTASATPKSSQLAPVPSTAIVIARIDWQAVRSQPSLGRLVRVEPVRELLRVAALSEGDVTSITAFSDLALTGASGLIVSGRFDGAQAIQHLQENGWSSSLVRGMKVLRRGTSESAALVRAGLVLGTPDGVAGVMDADASSARRLNPSSRLGRVFGVASKGSLGFAMSLRESADDAVDLGAVLGAAMLDLAGFGPASAVLERLATVRALGVSVAGGRDFVGLSVTAVLRDAGAARSAADSFGLMKTSALYLSGMSTSDSTLASKAMIESLRCEARGSTLSLSVRLPIDLVPR